MSSIYSQSNIAYGFLLNKVAGHCNIATAQQVSHLEIEHTYLLHLLECWNDPLLVAPQLLHAPLEPLQLLGLSLLCGG